ncbi:RES family NAD+ phosphorylase [Nemorincola caseinilytica]|uniref:RES family NAD+ phosphorylase n=1 Tax=Nemorincola caseinilytica TaxID=2054315 RepID=A0ABP8NPA7_9BACT
MIVYRIADCRYITDLTGTGAALYGGRWNSKNTYMLYTAQSASLALLEAIVHMGKLPPSGFCMARIELPDSIAPAVRPEKLPKEWYTSPPPDVLKGLGDGFVKRNEFLAMPVPSVLVNEEYNYLINPHHPLAPKIRSLETKPMNIDGRIFKK